jgi:hypothetical protein
MSVAARAAWSRPETRAKISAAQRAAWSRPEVRERMRGDTNPAKRPETRAKISAAKKEWASHPEVRAKISAAQRAAMSRPERRANHRAVMSSQETREKMRASHLGKHLSPETRAKIGIASRAAWSTPEVREKISGERSPAWRGGVSFEPYCPKFNDDFRERVRSFWEYRCGLCGKTQVENGKALSVHHVHYRKEACCEDEAPRYFIPLCASCHSKTGRARDHWQKILSRKIDKKFNGRCYFRQGEVLTSWGVKA